MDTKKIGQLIKKTRKDQKITQADAAGLLNVGTRFLSDLENGKPTIQLGKALTILEGLGLEVIILPRKQRKLIDFIKEKLDGK
ncbi:MAG: helix-turn-helix transcriptional regulator [Desulfobacteraceae bacterium]|nr:helix-turn-helix transcriptional regulator [Desulfobacteraceae bacterium]